MDRRQTYRFPCSTERSDAQVELPGKSCVATLVDESTGGFRLHVDGADLSCELDQQLQVKTSSGWHEVQVVRSTPSEDGLDLGLLRLEDYVEEGSTPSRKQPRQSFRRPVIGSLRGEYLIGLAIILVVPLMPILFQKLIVIPDQQVATENGDGEERDIPTLAGKAAPFIARSSPESSQKSSSQVARNVSSSVLPVSKAADHVIGAGAQGVEHLLRGSSQLVQNILSGLSVSNRGRLEEVVDDYSELPSPENLNRFENLLEEPEYDPLQKIVNQGQASLSELAGLIFTEFHRN